MAIESLSPVEPSIDLRNLPAEDIYSLQRATENYGPTLEASNSHASGMTEKTVGNFRPVIRALARKAIPSGNYLPDLDASELVEKRDTATDTQDTLSDAAINRIIDERIDSSEFPESYALPEKSLAFAARCVLRGAVGATAKADRKSYAQVLDALHADHNTQAVIDRVEHPVMSQLKRLILGKHSIL